MYGLSGTARSSSRAAGQHLRTQAAPEARGLRRSPPGRRSTTAPGARATTCSANARATPRAAGRADDEELAHHPASRSEPAHEREADGAVALPRRGRRRRRGSSGRYDVEVAGAEAAVGRRAWHPGTPRGRAGRAATAARRRATSSGPRDRRRVAATATSTTRSAMPVGQAGRSAASSLRASPTAAGSWLSSDCSSASGPPSTGSPSGAGRPGRTTRVRPPWSPSNRCRTTVPFERALLGQLADRGISRRLARLDAAAGQHGVLAAVEAAARSPGAWRRGRPRRRRGGVRDLRGGMLRGWRGQPSCRTSRRSGPGGEGGDERLLGDLDAADHLHPLLALLLLLQQLRLRVMSPP